MLCTASPVVLAQPGVSPAVELVAAGWLQSDWVIHRESSLDEIDPSTGAPLNEERFVLRRARLRVDGAFTHVLGRIELDMNSVRGLEVRPFDVTAAVGWAAAGPVRRLTDENERGARAEAPRSLALLGTIGLFRIPFGFDAREAPTRRPLLERSRVVRALLPGQRDFGLGLDAEYRVFRLAVALMNGSPIGEAGTTVPDFTARHDLVGRVGVDAGLGSRCRLQAGFSGLYGAGLHSGTAATKDELSWQDGDENGLVEVSELGVIPGAPATPSRPFDHFALGADARLRVALPLLGELTLRAELIRAQNLDRAIEPADPVAAGRDLRELGWIVGVAQELTPLAQLAVQYESYDPDADARGERGAAVVPRDARYTTWSFAGSLRLAALRLMAQYDHQTNALGRGPNGEPTSLADDSLTLRAELAF